MVSNIKLLLLQVVFMIFVNSVVLVALVFVIPLSLIEPIIHKESKFRDIPESYKKLFNVWYEIVVKILSIRKSKDS